MPRRFSFRRVLSAFTLVLCLAACGCATQLYDNLSEAEANAIMATLLEAGIVAEKRPGTEGSYIVMVDADSFARAVRLLDDKALPARRFAGLGEVFGQQAMFSTPMEEKARYLYALQQELSQTVSAIDGVLDARVHLVLPEQDQLGRELQVPSAAVLVRHVDDGAVDPAAYRLEIVRLVAAAVPELDEERIVVSFFPAPRAAVEPGAGELGWTTVWGVRVEAGAERRLLGLAGLSLLAGLLVGGGLAAGALAWRSKRRAGGQTPPPSAA